MRRAAKIDGNQAKVVQYLRGLGMTVQPLSAVGQGVPDLLVGFRGMNFLVEVKDGDQFPSHRVLTKMQQEWHAMWSGSVVVANSAEDAATKIARMSLAGTILEAMR